MPAAGFVAEVAPPKFRIWFPVVEDPPMTLLESRRAKLEKVTGL